MFLAGAVVTDLVKDRIYNAWVVPGLVTGVATSLFQGTGRLKESLLAIGATFLVLLPVYFFRGIAAGDVKLFMSAASYLSMQDALSCVVISFIIAGVISIAILILRRNKQKTIHFAVPILLSVLCVIGGVL